MEKNLLRFKADLLTGQVYRLTDNFPKEELYVLTSQLRRAILSVPANIIEGYSRRRRKVYINHLEISYASLAEVKYYLRFAYKRNYFSKKNYLDTWKKSEEMSKILWKSIETLSKNDS